MDVGSLLVAFDLNKLKEAFCDNEKDCFFIKHVIAILLSNFESIK